MGDLDFARRVTDLRSSFDGSFADARGSEEAREKFLAVRAGGTRLAFRLLELSSVAVDRGVTPAPSPLPELVGIAGVRGRLVPVYSLSVLIGGERAGAPSRWLVLVADGQVGLAVDEFEGYVFGRKADVASTAGVAAHCPETLRIGSAGYGVLDVTSLVKEISSRVASARPRQEHR